MSGLALMVGMLAVFYVVLLLPQQRRMKTQRQMLASLEVGDEVLLSSGIYGQIVEFDGPTMFLAVSDSLEIKVTKESVAERVVYAEPSLDAAATDEVDQ